MSAVVLVPIDPCDLAAIHRTGRDLHGHAAEPFTDAGGGSQLRCCLERSAPGERLLLVAHAPLGADRPWREVGPVFVHAGACPRPHRPGAFPAWLDEAPRVLRAYGADGAMRYAANRVVEAGEGVEAALVGILEDPDVAEVHVRNLLAQCFITRATRP
ncbi:DUF1203 domain-containing protein [Oryzobacter telluris]|uniref:DUF1203 domain-containing protein n=1 Tax=Oryzobacter telluris TaxID=3149179 RepID=UPI00370D9D75